MILPKLHVEVGPVPNTVLATSPGTDTQMGLEVWRVPAVLGLHPLGPSMAVGVTSNMGTTSGVTDSVESTSLLIGSSSSKGHSNVSNDGCVSENFRGVGNTDRELGADLLRHVLAVLMSTMAMISSWHSWLLLDRSDNIVSLRLLGDGPRQPMTLLLGDAKKTFLYPAACCLRPRNWSIASLNYPTSMWSGPASWSKVPPPEIS